MKIAAIGDIHCDVNSTGKVKEMLRDAEQADVLVLTGDLTDLGQAKQMETLLNELSHFSLPIIAVPGNHDYECDENVLLFEMMRQSGIFLLETTACTIDGVDFVGTKGFCGGFGTQRVQPFGEPYLKNFILTTFQEVKRLEETLKTLKSPRRVGVMHYSPVKETLIGEPPEIYAFLGCSLYADILDLYGVDVILHSHAHHGSAEGSTRRNTPVYNVSRFVRRRFGPTEYLLLDF